LKALGAKAVYDPFLTECCGSYHTVHNKDLVVDKVYRILNSAAKRGAEAIITSCPLCHFNLDRRQESVAEKYGDTERMPILYFTQLLAIALGLGQGVCNFDIHFVDPIPLLKQKHLL
jgi:heterodisulfide reductase subunit B